MQDVTSFVKAQSPLSLSTTGAESKKGSSPKTNLFSLLLAGLAQAKAEIKLDSTPSDVKTAPLKEEPKNTKESPKKAKSVDEHLLADLLKVVESLKTNSPLPLLPTLKSSSQLEKVLNNQTALKEFTEVKNIGDLMTLSKKYTLGLEKLTFTKESVETLQKEFPTLAKSTFFEALTHDTEALDLAKSNDETPVEKALVFNPLEKNIKKSEPQETPSALKELMSKEPKNSKEEDVRGKSTPALDTHSKETAKSSETIVVQKVISPLKEESKTDKKPLPEPFALKDALEESAELPIERKPAALTRTSEPKAETSSLQKGVVEAILQTIKVEKPHTQKVTEQPEPIQTETLASQPTATSQQLSDEMLDITPLSNETKVTTKQEIATKQVIAPKESLGQFANDLKEKIEAYKPPIMKVELSLFPKNLGEVDVTLLTRGNNLHVNITSNASTMTLFTQNQAEFKNALVNMGFTNLEMNFSDQRGNESGQQHQQKKNSETFFDELSESTGSELATIELVVPRYV
jgi:flagellar hook-length control protein FliK